MMAEIAKAGMQVEMAAVKTFASVSRRVAVDA
jgi:hypothetical protein